jgi:predicted amidophosphoribosyltransferase
MICPECRRGYPADAEFCPHDRAALVPYALYRRADAASDSLPRICPVCGERYAQHVTFCGKDGSSLTTVN